jgi:hypothetical protein
MPAGPAEVVERARTVPSSLRRFSVGPREASRAYGVRAELLEELLDLGLPAQRVDGEQRCDRLDLMNLSLHLGLPSMQLHALVGARRTLEAVSGRPQARFTLEYQTRCERCPPGAGGSFAFLVPPGRRVVATDGQPVRVEVRRRTDWPELPREAEVVADGLADLWFWQLPPPLSHDVGFAREHRLAECHLAGRLVVEEARRLGLEPRMRLGVQAAVPFAEAHAWAEIRVEGVWVPFDPQLRRVLVHRAGLDPASWPATRSLGAILVPIRADPRRDVAVHDGHPTRPTIVTRVHAGGRAGERRP